MGDAPDKPRLVVFSDDWGRHPSSCQHLVGRLPGAWEVLWVNTLGTRRPELSFADLQRAAGKLGRSMPPVCWFLPPQKVLSEADRGGAGRPRVINPFMYPGFRTRWQRRFNAGRLSRAVNRVAKTPVAGRPRAPWVAVTTLPIMADLVGLIDVDRWVYYCVDDFSVWPGVDHAVMDAMERELVGKVDAVVCVSETLRDRLRAMGREDVEVLPHGIDEAHWGSPSVNTRLPKRWPDTEPLFLFWGLIDARMDSAWCARLVDSSAGRLVLAGPVQESSLMLDVSANWVGPVDYHDLPALAAAAAVLVMPYVDAPVTRAMQPLKLLEYLATGKPVVVRDLPATRAWADCCDLAATADEFVALCRRRAETGLPADQRAARQRRLPAESWSEKAAAFDAVLRGEPMTSP